MKKTQTAVACAAGQIPVDGVPEEIKILPLGLVRNVHKDFTVDDESCEAIIWQFKGRKLDLVIDYEHQTLKDIQAPAGGWIKDIWKGTDALVAKVEWTPKAKEYLQNKEYRYLSPVVLVRKTDNKAVALHSVALTNTPAIDGMFAIVNSSGLTDGTIEIEFPEEGGEENMEFLKKMAAMLGLPETATEDDVENALNALLKKGTEEVVANSTILSMLDLKDGAKTEDVTGKIQQLKNGDAGVNAELIALKEKLAKKEAADAVAVALKAGKISAAQTDWAEGYALKDPDGFKAFCEKAAPVVPMGKLVPNGQKGKAGKAEVDMAVLKAMGLTQEDLDKYGENAEE